jgi:transposase
MANLLQVVMVETILSLHARRWSVRRIARELGIDRETVSRHIRLSASDSKPAKAPIGSGPSDSDSKPAKAPIGSDDGAGDSKPANTPIDSGAVEGTDLTAAAVGDPGPALAHSDVNPDAEAASTVGRFSDCAPWRDAIQSMLALGLSAQRIYQDLVADHGFTGSYYSVRRFVSRLGAKLELPFRRMECGPGEEAQVDFGTGAPVLQPDGTRRRTHVFRIVLSHSRKAYSESVYRQTTESFIRCLENAFWHFGGVPQRLVLDNLRAAVRKADWFEPELNPQVRSFAAHYGTAFLPTRPYMPRHKGKVERGVDYVQENALRGRKFNTLEEQNRFLLTWEATVADTRLHGTTRKQVGKHFETVERGALQRLPAERFPCFRESRRTVHRDGHVEVEKAYYSVPPEYLARPVWVRWDARLVRIFDERMKSIAVHVKHEAGRFSTQSQHIAGPKINSVERGAAWLLGKVRRIGPQSLRWAEAVIANRGVEGIRVLQGLLNLAQRHPSEALEQACDVASSHGSHHLRTIRSLLKRPAAKQEPLPFLNEHPLIRNLSDYGQFVHDSFHKEVN